jgi:hypothetical protein
MIFIERLLSDAMAYDGPIQSPTEAVQEGDDIIGTANQKIQRLYCFVENQRDAINAAIRLHNTRHEQEDDVPAEECQQLAGRARRCDEALRCIESCIREEFGLWTRAGAVRIRENWQVVLCPCRCEPNEFFAVAFANSLEELLTARIMPLERDPNEMGN